MSEERILVVDDEPGVRSALEAILADEGFEVSSVESGESGLDALERDRFDAVLLDVWLPGMDGLDTLKHIRERNFDTQVVMISGHGTIDTAVRATKLGAFDFVEKPLSLEKTLLVLRNALRTRRLESVNRNLLRRLSHDTEIIGQSPSAEKLRREIELAIDGQAPVLIQGELGSGRETVARRIHAAAQAPEAPFVEVPCAALDAQAAERVLFGAQGEPGRIRLAHGGTLFLEDIDRLPVELQRRVASAVTEQARGEQGFRIVASADAVAQLEPDLRQKLDVIRIDVPALRSRREDVPLFAERFMQELSREYARQPKRLAPDCLEALKAWSWPGNVRELRNLVERLLLFAEGDTVERSALPESLGGARAPAEDLYRDFGSLREGVEAFERYYIARVMAKEGGDPASAAKRLGITPATLGQRLKQL